MKASTVLIASAFEALRHTGKVSHWIVGAYIPVCRGRGVLEIRPHQAELGCDRVPVRRRIQSAAATP